jgi:phosphonate transport system ATP-binding protein
VAIPFVLEGATVRYGDTVALDGIDLRFEAGEAVALVGPSGAGKTTLLRLLNGTVRPTAGRVIADGRDLSSLSAAGLRSFRARVGFVAQHLALVDELRVIQNVVSGRVGRRSLAGSLRDLLFPAPDTKRAAHALLEQVGIPEKLYERTDSLSGGQRQRVAIARALFQEPDALLADEPVSSVDPARASATLELLHRLRGDGERTLLVSLHDRERARASFPRLIGVRDGKIRFDLPRERVTDDDLDELYRIEDPDLVVG